MSVSHTIQCPSGLNLTVRELTGEELQAVMDAPDDQLDGVQLLNKCITTVHDTGPLYKDWPEKGPWPTDDLILGDATLAMLGIKIATYGPKLDLDLQCPHCKHANNYTIDVTTLPVKPLDEEAIRRLIDNEPFVTPVRGHNVHWLPARQREQKLLSKQAQLDPSKRVALGASLRVRKIDGVHENDKLLWLAKLGLGVLEEFMSLCDYFDGGIETTQAFRCGSLSCMATINGEIPLDRRLFVRPRAEWKKTGKRPNPNSAIG